MYTYRLTKYNPKYRNKAGAYTKNEWTEFSDIGKSFSGKILTRAQYDKVEDSYVKILSSFLQENGIVKMKINRVQNAKNIRYKSQEIKKNQTYSLEDLETLFRLILQGKFWCKFKNSDGSYIDFGWDYYSYIGIPKAGKKTLVMAKKLKLFIEKCPEPILD